MRFRFVFRLLILVALSGCALLAVAGLRIVQAQSESSVILEKQDPAAGPKIAGELVELSAAEIAQLDLSEVLRVKITRPQSANTSGRPTKSNGDATGPQAAIQAALKQSIAYYLTLDEDRVFRLPLAAPPEQTEARRKQQARANEYTVKELIQSASRFMQLLRRPPGPARRQALAREFRVFESRRGSDALFTGYYTPRVPVAAKARKGDMPIYGPPQSLIRISPREFWPAYTGPVIVGRVDQEQRKLVPFYTQHQILFERALPDRPLYYANAGDAYQMQLQGGAFLEWAPGETQPAAGQPGYFGYAADNGHNFKSPGARFSRSRVTLRRAALARPAEFRKGLARNPRFIFFERQGGGPSGSLKTPLTPGRSIAMDPAATPPGLPAFVSSASASHTVRRFVAVQDTGNAIRGHGRLDFYWGHSTAAEHRALRFKQRGRLLLFVRAKRTGN